MIGLGNELRKFKAKKIGTIFCRTDVALLKIDDEYNLAAITLPISDKAVEPATLCWPSAIRSAWRQTVTMGIISAVGGGMGIVDYENFIQTDAAINIGNSGGALVDVEVVARLTRRFLLAAAEIRESALPFPQIWRVRSCKVYAKRVASCGVHRGVGANPYAGSG